MSSHVDNDEGQPDIGSPGRGSVDGTDHGRVGAGQAHYGTIFDGGQDGRLSAEEMDEQRKENIAYEYLCHLEEAKQWMEACVAEELPSTTALEKGLMNGVYLAKLAHFFCPEVVPLRKIYDREQTRYKASGLHFRHTDNIVHWLKAMERIDFPTIFHPETTDIYDRKNMPRLVYCIHALSLYLFKLGKASQIQNLIGKVEFTEEEISNMRKELDKYGIHMPAFSKIGGVLANEMTVDEAALHAAVIAINEALDRREPEHTLNALKNPAAYLVSLDADNMATYQQLLFAAKQEKVQNALNRSIDPNTTYEPDVYDELLTQAEMQGFINKSNLEVALEAVSAAVEAEDEDALVRALQNPVLGLREISKPNSAWYLRQLLEAQEQKRNNNSGENGRLDRDEIQSSVISANTATETHRHKTTAVAAINTALDGDDPVATVQALNQVGAQLPHALEEGATLYHYDLRGIKQEKQADLEYEEIAGGIKVLTAIAKINLAVEMRNAEMMYEALVDRHAHISGLEESHQDKYQDRLHALRAQKRRDESPCEFLVHFEIQDVVEEVNRQVQEEHARVEAIHSINDAIDLGETAAILEALQLPAAGLDGIEAKHAEQYARLLLAAKESKAMSGDDDSETKLWLEDIQHAVSQANKQACDADNMCVMVSAVNRAVEQQDSPAMLEAMQHPGSHLHSVVPDCADSYMQKLQAAKETKVASTDDGAATDSPWLAMTTKEGSYPFYVNVDTAEWTWEAPEGFSPSSRHLSRDEIQSCVLVVTAAHDRQLLFKANEPFVVKIQALVRGHQARKQFRDRQNFMNKQLPAIVNIQAHWRGYKQKKKYSERLEELGSHPDDAMKIQSVIRMWLARKHYQQRLKYFADNEREVVKLQAWWRSNLARHDYSAFTRSENPPLNVVRKFVHLLDNSDLDYEEELELQRMKEKVVAVIRSNQKLEQDLNMMDIKIGLLVRNRLTLQDVVAHGRKLKHHNEIRKLGDAYTSGGKGVKSLSKESRELLEAYQHLFYQLQTNPHYLARLIFAMPQSRTTKFMESVILTLYNYAGNQREEFLLNKLFKTALEEEIRARVSTPGEIVTGNPMVIQMVLGFNRKARGLSSLREPLNPLVTKVINDKTLNINTNPIDVYKQWVNNLESKTGQASGLPYDVTIEQALEHEEVRQQIEVAIRNLKNNAKAFIQAIMQSMDKIPYGMRYIAKILKDALQEKFPDSPEKEILKIIGNLLYYRYINSAIVAPDQFDIIDVGPGSMLTNDQRRNLASVAKILQFAASNKGFGGDSAHLSCLNPFIKECHEKFKKFFREACVVEEPEQHYNMDHWVELTMVTKPTIYISLQEMHDTHQLLMEHQDVVAPDESDQLHELLADLGEPDLDTLIGQTEGNEAEALSRAQLSSTEILLTLSNKFELLEEDVADTRALYLRTKRMIADVIRSQQGESLAAVLDTGATDSQVSEALRRTGGGRMIADVIRSQQGESLAAVLDTGATDSQEEDHESVIKLRDIQDVKNQGRGNKVSRQQSMLRENRLPLDRKKDRIRANLAKLEEAGLVSRENGYQSVINDIAQDIRNWRRYRQRRKQEMAKMRQTLSSLESKAQHNEKQIDYYNQYVKSCLDDLQQRGGGRKAQRRSFFGGSKDETSAHKKPSTAKYTAPRLYEKGVLLEIDGEPANKFKNVQFGISSTEKPGVFEVTAKFLGVDIQERVELVFQDLLQLQYEGVAVMNMFDRRAKVNVNLLIFLLNQKFYGKSIETRHK
ncbi:PREDICTED: ras GTPase-activating-like protein IQGAP1 [Priapulus caudatus]|uniref:Ras GTPase-activating-like protein IQGAP1 n=1 Tax=Priapulus caudatus TaxID=37621 RepID=A0ABM1EI09_PRICU|nr:PREDICTED: ras GTPase-activating-like protein IQGAP1 [Priapulus caudatus]